MRLPAASAALLALAPAALAVRPAAAERNLSLAQDTPLLQSMLSDGPRSRELFRYTTTDRFSNACMSTERQTAEEGDPNWATRGAAFKTTWFYKHVPETVGHVHFAGAHANRGAATRNTGRFCNTWNAWITFQDDSCPKGQECIQDEYMGLGDYTCHCKRGEGHMKTWANGRREWVQEGDDMCWNPHTHECEYPPRLPRVAPVVKVPTPKQPTPKQPTPKEPTPKEPTPASPTPIQTPSPDTPTPNTPPSPTPPPLKDIKTPEQLREFCNSKMMKDSRAERHADTSITEAVDQRTLPASLVMCCTQGCERLRLGDKGPCQHKCINNKA